MTDPASERRRMAAVLSNKGVLKSPWLRGAIETIPASSSSILESSSTRGGPGGPSPPSAPPRTSG
ncbi:hypothetical protein SAV31267_031740 [Streptomyces avermitilis]|uniref:Uncharacterized protein n=1 Tax=Streptomyces avermitilis TaxID=33903 RepID=A0A4D4MQK1_STRAX|nr:hypothetical protein SAV31267_031740 [Streptomyces avermitilis]